MDDLFDGMGDFVITLAMYDLFRWYQQDRIIWHRFYPAWHYADWTRVSYNIAAGLT